MSTAMYMTKPTQDAFGLGAEGKFLLDKNVIAALPEGSIVTSANEFGSSTRNTTTRVNVTSKDGTPKSYFVKVCHSICVFAAIPLVLLTACYLVCY